MRRSLPRVQLALGAFLLAALAVTSVGCRNRGAQQIVPPPTEVPPSIDRELVHPAAPISMRIPTSWSDELSEGAITLVSGQEEVVMILVAIDATDLADSLKSLNDELGRIVQGAEISEITEDEVGGMAAMVADGQGTMDGQAVELGLMLLRADDGTILLIVGVALDDASDDAKRETIDILASFRPVS